MFVEAYDYKQWADERIIAAVNLVCKRRVSDTFEFMLQQLNHMVIVEELFKSRLEGKSAPHASTNTPTVPAIDLLTARIGNSNSWYRDFVGGLCDPDAVVSFVFADGKQGKMSQLEILFHILNHGSYHRGNIAHALDLAGVAHPPDGYGIYIHEQEPARRAS